MRATAALILMCALTATRVAARAAVDVSLSAADCQADAGCSYNGHCGDDGTCHCLPQWGGPHCASLRLLATAQSAGLQDSTRAFSWDAPTSYVLSISLALALMSRQTLVIRACAHRSSCRYWGGSVLRGDDGQFHMWASEIVAGCGIWTWMPNSQVVHAVSDSLSKPFRRREVVFPPFAHGKMSILSHFTDLRARVLLT